MKNGVEVPTGVRSRYRVKSEGTKHFLVIDDASKEDTGTYSVMASGGTSEAHVQVDCMQRLWPFYDVCLFVCFSKGFILINHLFSVLYPSNTVISEATEDLPRPAGYDGEAG